MKANARYGTGWGVGVEAGAGADVGGHVASVVGMTGQEQHQPKEGSAHQGVDSLEQVKTEKVLLWVPHTCRGQGHTPCTAGKDAVSVSKQANKPAAWHFLGTPGSHRARPKAKRPSALPPHFPKGSLTPSSA